MKEKKTIDEKLEDMKMKKDDPTDIALQKINAKSDETLIKYYNLRAQSRKAAHDLEVNLQKHFIAEAPTEDGTSKTFSQSTYDSEGFDILYKKSNSRKNVELVVKATPENILELQDYLSTSNFEKIEAKNVYYATFQFITPLANKETTGEYIKNLDHYFKLRYPQLKDWYSRLYLENTKLKHWWYGLDYRDGYTGRISGLVTDILEIRKFLLKGVYSNGRLVEVKKESVTFSSKIP